MSSTIIGAMSAGCIFGGALLGLWLQKRVPEHHRGKDSHEIVKLGAGMIATLTALIMGLLVSSAKSTFDTINSGIMQAGAKVILLDRDLAHYGPETKAAREQLRRTLAVGIETIWPKLRTGVSGLTTVERAQGVEVLQDRLRELAPQDDAQRQLLGQARQLAEDLAQTRWMLIEQAHSELPISLILVLVFWLTMLFITFGLFAPHNGTVLTVLLVGACSMSLALFLVLEMSRPIDGLIHVSNAPLVNALELLGR